ncbi:hypothetical protein HDU92_001573 [Lobulomyces angularis]|nr:hypothetical protein HDU92_001573 [Lobulomyces angularis]
MGGQMWGNQGSHQIGFYEYGISPFHLKPFKGFFNPGAFNFFKRNSRNLAYIAPPFLALSFAVDWADKKFEYYNRKEYLLSPEGIAARA